MSSYSDFSNAASDILLKKGDVLAQGKRASGELLGSTIANLGQVIPQQVQQAMQQAAQRKKQAQIQQIFQQSGGDLEKASTAIMAIDPKLGSELLKAHTEAKKSAFELQKLDWEYKKAKAEAVDRMLGGVNDEQSYVHYALARKELGDVQGLPDHYDPAWVQQQKISHLSFKDQLELEKPKDPAVDWQETIENGVRVRKAVPRVAGTVVPVPPPELTPDQVADNARQDAAAKALVAQREIENKRAAAMLSLAQQRELRESQNNKEPLIAVMKDGKAVLVKRSQAEGMTPASGESGVKELTQAQTLDAGYAHRIDDAETTLKKVEDHIAKMGLIKFTAQSKFPAKAQSAEFQQYDQASRNLINAILRRESGAAISQSEFDNARRQYLPQPGDDPETLKLKTQNRRRQKEALAAGAGRAYTPDTPTPTTPKKVGRFVVEVQP